MDGGKPALIKSTTPALGTVNAMRGSHDAYSALNCRPLTTPGQDGTGASS